MTPTRSSGVLAPVDAALGIAGQSLAHARGEGARHHEGARVAARIIEDLHQFGQVAHPVPTRLEPSAFGEHLPAVRRAMERLAASLDPAELNRVGLRLYERFRPEVPTVASGWGAEGELHLARIEGAAG